MNNRRIYSYDLIKLIGMVLIILHHSNLMEGILVRAYVFVEFFFFVAGFMICMRFSRKHENVLQHFVHRCAYLWPKYFLVLIIYFCMLLIGKHEIPYKTFGQAFGETFLLQSLGIPNMGGINYPCWFLSVLLYSDLIIFLLLKLFSKKVYITITLIISIAFYVMMIVFFPDTIEVWNYQYIFFSPLWRGFIAMLLGTNVFYLTEKIGSSLDSRVLRIIEQITFGGVIILCFINLPFFDYVAILLLLVLLLLSNSEKSLFNTVGKNKVVRFLCKHQYSLFLNHAWVIEVTRHFFKKFSIDNVIIKCFATLIIVFIVSFLFDLIYERFVKFIGVQANEKK